MSAVPTHDELREQLPAAALGSLDGPDQGRLMTHVSECAECARHLSEYHQVVAAISLRLPERGFGPERQRVVRARLMERIRAAAEPDDPGVPRLRHRTRLAAAWAGWGVAAGLAGVLMIHHAVHRPVDYGWLTAGVLGVAVVALAIVAGRQLQHVRALGARLARLQTGESPEPRLRTASPYSDGKAGDRRG